jgi:alkanesulfonate monooxygenase SsuD/methylene tetrahydromethanopterin reductase-like flavin-dependent oxidoreductase (luciferase family)
VDVGIGLASTIPDTEGRTLVDWAKAAEEAGFSTLGTIGRLVYLNYEELIALSAAAAVTSRIRLTTSVLLAPLYSNAALLAKQAASLDRLSGGRLVLGLAVGGRDDDFTASGVSMHGRGRRLEEQVAIMKRVWSGEEFGTAGGIGPEPARPGGPEIILGGTTEASFTRVARIADGWIMGGGAPDMFAQRAADVDRAWHEARRPGRPRKLTLAYFALGPDARAQADGYLQHYYGWLGDIANMIAAGAAVMLAMSPSQP